jgi:Regulator of ribonuclease activity B
MTGVPEQPYIEFGPVQWFNYFPDEAGARAFAAALPDGLDGLEVNPPEPPLEDDPEDEGIPEWGVLFYGDPELFGGAEDIATAQEFLEQLAQKHGGECDGHERAIAFSEGADMEAFVREMTEAFPGMEIVEIEDEEQS